MCRVYKRVNIKWKANRDYISQTTAQNDGEKNFWDNLIFHRRDVSRCPEISSWIPT